MRIKLSTGDKFFYVVDYFLLFLVILVTLYPFVYVLSASVSDPLALAQGKVWLFPVGLQFSSYITVFTDPELWMGYGNTIWYVLVGTLINLIMTTLLAYPVSRKNFGGRRFLMLMVAFTMFFNGGMVPTYLLVKNLNMLNTRWAIVVPAAINTWNMIIMRSFFESLPEPMFEAARIDGCNDIMVLVSIVLPLSGAILAVMVLFYSVAHWNSYLYAMMYISNEKLHPLQMYLRKILIQNQVSESTGIINIYGDKQAISQTIRYATVIVSVVPILLVYPFIQRYFVLGVMVGAVKG